MSRYEKTKTSSTKDKNKVYYRTTIYNTVSEEDSDLYFIAQEGDRCDNLAFRFYGDPTLWWFIAKINNLNSMNIPTGTNLRIPISTKDAEGF